MTAKSKSHLMKGIRSKRKKAGLIRREYWATKKHHEELKAALDGIKHIERGE